MCIEKYIELYKSNNTKDWELSISLEKVGTDFIKCLQNGNDIDSDAALDFINKVETWKAMGIKKRIKGVGKNTSPQALQAITNVFNNQENKKKIEALHTLYGFGISQHKDNGTKPAKVATAAMRFLYPEEWGVVDWRSGTIAKCLVDSSDICEAINLAQKKKKRYWKDSFSHINSEWAVKINEDYKKIGRRFGIQKNSEVDQFLFGISLEIWGLNLNRANKCRKR